MANVYDVAKYVLKKLGSMSTMKLQKEVYYCQAWSLGWDGKPLFDEDFQAWAARSVRNCSPGTKGCSGLLRRQGVPVAQLFSLRLTARERLYGILNNGVFYVLWYDPCHEIYESKIS